MTRINLSVAIVAMTNKTTANPHFEVSRAASPLGRQRVAIYAAPPNFASSVSPGFRVEPAAEEQRAQRLLLGIPAAAAGRRQLGREVRLENAAHRLHGLLRPLHRRHPLFRALRILGRLPFEIRSRIRSGKTAPKSRKSNFRRRLPLGSNYT